MLIETAMLPDLRILSARHHDNGHKIGFVNGAFDMLHDGHRYLLDYARANCNVLIVALNTGEGIRRSKGPGRPIQSTGCRVAALREGFRIDLDLLFDAPDPSEILAAVQPDLYVMGSDYRGKPIPGAEHCREIVFLDRLPGLSTTELMSRGNG